MYKKCKVVMLATKNKTGTFLYEYEEQLCFNIQRPTIKDKYKQNPKHLYILSDDEIKEDDWYIDDCDQIRQAVTSDEEYWDRRSGYKKIIATTNSSLGFWKEMMTKNSGDEDTFFSLPSIPQLFIDKYVSEYNKGNKIEEVMVEYYEDVVSTDASYPNNTTQVFNLKLTSDNTINIKSIKDSWNREEVINLCHKATIAAILWDGTIVDFNTEFNKWIESNL